jgi:hypothetical protein
LIPIVNDVETILNQIRERVRADHEPTVAQDQLVIQDQLRMARKADDPPNEDLSQPESLNLLAAYLTTTSRAWDRLPPTNSERKGGAAQVELWIKHRLKSMSRWFTWEQVNFNSAVHHALAETLDALSTYAQELARQESERSALAREAVANRDKLDRTQSELATLRAVIENQAAREAVLEARCAEIEARLAAINVDAIERNVETARTVTAEIASARGEMASQISEVVSELRANTSQMRDSTDQLREEQRVCFKQLSLEVSETAVTTERARRVVERRLDKLEKEIELQNRER